MRGHCLRGALVQDPLPCGEGHHRHRGWRQDLRCVLLQCRGWCPHGVLTLLSSIAAEEFTENLQKAAQALQEAVPRVLEYIADKGVEAL